MIHLSPTLTSSVHRAALVLHLAKVQRTAFLLESVCSLMALASSIPMPQQLPVSFFTGCLLLYYVHVHLLFFSFAIPSIPHDFLLFPFLPLVPCSQSDTLNGHTRCLILNSTGQKFSLDSCYFQNGGCSEEQVCYSEEVEDDGNCYNRWLEPCGCSNPWSGPCTKTSCRNISGEEITIVTWICLPLSETHI